MELVEVFEFVTLYRSGSRGGVAPSLITVLGSIDGAKWEEVGEIADDGKGPAKDRFTSRIGK